MVSNFDNSLVIPWKRHTWRLRPLFYVLECVWFMLPLGDKVDYFRDSLTTANSFESVPVNPLCWWNTRSVLLLNIVLLCAQHFYTYHTVRKMEAANVEISRGDTSDIKTSILLTDGKSNLIKLCSDSNLIISQRGTEKAWDPLKPARHIPNYILWKENVIVQVYGFRLTGIWHRKSQTQRCSLN